MELLGPAQETPEGVLLLEGIVAKPGVLEYRQPDGSIVRELVPKEELMRVDSLSTLGLKPFTNEHPKIPVDIDNMAEFRKGNVLQDVESLNGFVKVKILVDDPVTKDEIKQDGLRGLSPGYTVRIDKTPGNHPEFGPYDQIQRDRKYNHVAGTRKPRAGFAAHVRLDAEDAVMVVRADQEGQTHVHAMPGGQDFVSSSEDTPDHTHDLPQGNGQTSLPIATASGNHVHEIPGQFGGGQTGISQTTSPVPVADSRGSIRAMPKVRLDGIDYEVASVQDALALRNVYRSRQARIDELEMRLDALYLDGISDREAVEIYLEMATDNEAIAFGSGCGLRTDSFETRGDIVGGLAARKLLGKGAAFARGRLLKSKRFGKGLRAKRGATTRPGRGQGTILPSRTLLTQTLGTAPGNVGVSGSRFFVRGRQTKGLFGRKLKRSRPGMPLVAQEGTPLGKGLGARGVAERSKIFGTSPGQSAGQAVAKGIERLFKRDPQGRFASFDDENFDEVFDSVLADADEEAILDALDAFGDEAGEEVAQLLDALETADEEQRGDIFGRLKSALQVLLGRKMPAGGRFGGRKRKRGVFEKIGPGRAGLFDSEEALLDALDSFVEDADEEELLDALDALVEDGNEEAKELKDALEMTTDAEARADIFGAIKRFFRKRFSKKKGFDPSRFAQGPIGVDPFRASTAATRAARKKFLRKARRSSEDSREDAWLAEFNQASSPPQEPRADAQTTYKESLVNAHRRPAE